MSSLLKRLRRWWRDRLAWWYYWRGATHRHFANVRGDIKEYEMAVDDFTRAIELDSECAQAYLDRGILYWREFDHPRRAVQDLEAALAIDPELYEARFNRGVAFQQLGEYERALEDFRAYLEVGEHPYWREYAEKMVEEFEGWDDEEGDG